MLVLSRKVGQRVLVGGQIAITVVKVGQSGVRIGIEAPPELPIVREELLDRFGLMQDSIAGILEESDGRNGTSGNGIIQSRRRASLPAR